MQKVLVTEVGFEPTLPEKLVPKTSALDHSAIQPRILRTEKGLLLEGLEPSATRLKVVRSTTELPG